MSAAALYECTVRHVRTAPLRNAFTYQTYQWLVDVDALPRLPWWLRPLASFRAADHLGAGDASIRQNVERYLADEGIDLDGGKITMLTNARVLGYVFNPLSVYWCHHPDGSLACVIAEVHNTYGQRHCYLLRTDSAGRAQVPKEFYVSPFYPVDGSYQMSLPEPGERLALTVTLHRPGDQPFVASVRGERHPATTAELLRIAARHPWSTAVVTARIYAQGLKLYARRLPVLPRPRAGPDDQRPQGQCPQGPGPEGRGPHQSSNPHSSPRDQHPEGRETTRRREFHESGY